MTPRQPVVALQRGIPLVPRPFHALAQRIGSTEDELLETAQRMLDDGSARRFGAVFDSRRLGYRSELCALQLTGTALREVGRRISRHPGVTHCYERGHPPELPCPATRHPPASWPNLWFTLAVPTEAFETEMDAVKQSISPARLLRLPATRRFKIDVVFDPAHRDRYEYVPGTAAPQEPDGISPIPWSPDERALVRALQGQLPVEADCFTSIAEREGCSPDALLRTLQRWHDAGALRRIALILRHRRVGFTANAMCCWPVPENDMVEAGRRTAAWPPVTHCYQRPPQPGWPFTLYAMIHTGSWQRTHQLFQQISSDVGLKGGIMLGSHEEFKKTSMQYFPSTTEETP